MRKRDPLLKVGAMPRQVEIRKAKVATRAKLTYIKGVSLEVGHASPGPRRARLLSR